MIRSLLILCTAGGLAMSTGNRIASAQPYLPATSLPYGSPLPQRPGEWHADANRQLHQRFDAQIQDLNQWRRQSREQLDYQRRLARQYRGPERQWRMRAIDAQWREIDRTYDAHHRQLHESLAENTRQLGQARAALERDQRYSAERPWIVPQAGMYEGLPYEACPTWGHEPITDALDNPAAAEPFSPGIGLPPGPHEW